MAIETSTPLSISPDLLQRYNEAYSGHAALRDELLDITVTSGQVAQSETDEGTAFHFSSLRAGVRKNNDDLDPFAVEIHIHASDRGTVDSSGYVEQYGRHTPDFPLFIGYMGVSFGEIVKLTTDPDHTQDARPIGFPFVGFGLKLSRYVQLNLPACSKVLLTAATQTIEEQLSDARETLLPELKYGAERCKEDYEEFMTKVKYWSTEENRNQVAERSLSSFWQEPSPETLINASLKACIRTSDDPAKSIGRLFEHYARNSPELSSPLGHIDYHEMHLLALSKTRFANHLLEEAARFDRVYRQALSPRLERVEEIAKSYLTEYIERVNQVTAMINETKMSLGPVRT